MTTQSLTSRRQFAFWLSLGLAGQAGRLQAGPADDGVWLVPEPGQSAADSKEAANSGSVHWSHGSNSGWTWYERETFIDGRWQISGITTPRALLTGEPYSDNPDYLDEALVPEEIRRGGLVVGPPADQLGGYDSDGPGIGQPISERRSRHGRPPSRWLRSLEADELRIWLKTIRAPEAGVSGMTFWEHLTRDHGFDQERLCGLSRADQARLHAAAHHGY